MDTIKAMRRLPLAVQDVDVGYDRKVYIGKYVFIIAIVKEYHYRRLSKILRDTTARNRVYGPRAPKRSRV
jgi:hypothetical protein